MDSLERRMEDTNLTEPPHPDSDARTDSNEQLPDLVNWKRNGDVHLAFKRYKEAIAAYTKGIEEGDKSVEIRAGRACAYLQVNKYQCALDDVDVALTTEKYHIKCINRKVKALFGLTLYGNAKTYLESLLNVLDPKVRNLADDLLKKANEYIEQSEKGIYPWSELYRGSTAYHDMADYTRLVFVGQTATKGRGLFAKQNIQAGDLICANKALAYVEDSFPSNVMISLRFARGEVTEIHNRLIDNINKLMKEHPEKYGLLAKLFAGPELTYLTDDEPVYDEARDMKRIELISLFNSSSCPQRVNGSFCRSAGLWIIPSYINHSCVDANSSFVLIGDFFFVRAFKDIPEGAEIIMPYKVPTSLIAQKRLDQYGFICDCRLCQRDRLDDAVKIAYRETILKEIEKALEEFSTEKAQAKFCKADDLRIYGLFQKIDQSRADAPHLNLCYVTRLFEFGKLRLVRNRHAKTIVIYTKIYEMVKDVPGFEIYTILCCLKIILCYDSARDNTMRDKWILTLKQKTKLFFGTLQILYTQFIEYIDEMRLSDVAI